MKAKKAQAWGFDLIIATVIFLAGLIFFFVYVLNFPTEREEVFNSLVYEGEIIGDSLLSEGFPENWQINDVIAIGILSAGVVNDTKWKQFYDLTNSDYQKSQRLLNVENHYYVFFEEPIDVGEEIITGIGNAPASENNLVKTTRVVIQDNKIKNLNIYVWN
ncbi:hypothetical protein J4462_04950 [Candidatus Pacearchaeota archaeon]|nr:hypothetical protein [Candidatus Pacearchaeota archaeon]